MASIVSQAYNSANTISANNYDLVRAFATSRARDPIIIDQLIAAYTAIAANLDITVGEFIQTVQAQGTTRDQDLYLAARLNTVRVRNALLGVGGSNQTPLFVAREISA